MEIRAEFCRCTGARFWRSCHQSRVNERSESNRRHQASLSTFEVQGAAGRAVAIARCSVRRHRASCSSLDLSKTSSASVARTGPKKSHSEIISLSALPRRRHADGQCWDIGMDAINQALDDLVSSGAHTELTNGGPKGKCAMCGAKARNGQNLRGCEGCKITWYCGRECQVRASGRPAARASTPKPHQPPPRRRFRT